MKSDQHFSIYESHCVRITQYTCVHIYIYIWVREIGQTAPSQVRQWHVLTFCFSLFVCLFAK